MIDTRENAQVVVDLLNDLMRADPRAVKNLFTTRVPCNHELADHSHVIVKPLDDGAFDVGFLGIINALFGSEHRIGIKVDLMDATSDNDEVIKIVHGFEVVDAKDGRAGWVGETYVRNGCTIQRGDACSRTRSGG